MNGQELLSMGAVVGCVALMMVGCAGGGGGAADVGGAGGGSGGEPAVVSAERVAAEPAVVSERLEPVASGGGGVGEVVGASWTVRAVDDARPIAGESARLTVRGMSCPKCANNIDRQLQRVAGVSDVSIDMATGFVDVRFLGGARPSPRELSRAITNTGFTLVEVAER